MREAKHPHGIHDDEADQEENREVRFGPCPY